MKPVVLALASLLCLFCSARLSARPSTISADPQPAYIHRAPHPNPSAAYRWLDVLLEASGRDAIRNRPRPTVLSRTMAIVLTAMYDAWAAYDAKAVGTRLGGTLRRPPAERTLANKEQAIGQAAVRALLFVYPEEADWIREQALRMGVDAGNESRDTATPEGIGNAAADALIAYRRHDGANQMGDEVGGDGKPYADYTYYSCRNTPEHLVDPTCWMPIPFSDGKGGTVSPGFLTAHWYRVQPFALARSDQFRPPPPPKWGSRQLDEEVDEVLRVNAALTLEQKAIVEFMREGPRSTGQSGHWLQFAQDLSRHGRYDLDQDVKLFFAVGNVVMDAFIACWEAKRHYDTGRPYWWVRIYKKGQKIRGWAGPGKGCMEIAAEQWKPYSPDIFVTPPFPGYTSGHATASGAASTVLALFGGTDEYGAVEIRNAGEMTGEDAFTAAQMQAMDGRVSVDAASTKEVRLPMPTWTSVAEMAALSRLWGGYHIRTDNVEGLKLGRTIARYSWAVYESYFNGTAPVALFAQRKPVARK